MRRCQKMPLPNEQAAFAVARKMGRKGKFVQPYFCLECKRWHTGTSKRLRSKRLDALFDQIAQELRGGEV